MKKYTVKHLITSALLSLTALVVGYALLSLPFRLMDWLDPTQMKLVFALPNLCCISPCWGW